MSPCCVSVRPESDHLVQHLGPGDGGEGGAGPGPDPGGVMGRHLGHPVVVLPRPAHSDPPLTGDDVNVVSVERGLDPGGLHPQDLTPERDQPGVSTQPPGPEAGAVDRKLATPGQVGEILTPALHQHPACTRIFIVYV